VPRKTKQNSITSPELLEQINPENKRLVEDYLTYLESIQRSEKTIKSYKNDLEIFFTYDLQHLNNKFFVDITKRDIVSYQNWLMNENKNSPARIRRLKSTLSSLGNFIENILDDEYKDFRSIVKKIENPVNQPTREKTILTDEQCQTILDELVRRKKFDKACLFALAMCSGRRKSELVRFKVYYFDNENIIYGSLWRSPEKILTKGRGLGKMLTCYTLVKEFRPYFDLWMEDRKKRKIASEWLFPDKKNPETHMNADTINSWMLTCGKIIGEDVYCHCLRHFFCTHLCESGIPAEVVKEIIGWGDVSLVSLYCDTDTEDELGKYFDENGIKDVEKKSISDL